MRTLFASDKPFADCRVERGLTERVACLLGGGRAWGGGGASSVHGGPSCGDGLEGTRGAHVKHGRHGRDAGDVEAQRLVERRRALPSRKGSMGRGAYCGANRARAERTSNMLAVVVTLDVLKLSGWLNARASCRVEREAWEEW